MDMYQKRKIRKEKRENSNQNEKFHKVVLNWYPGHMARARREIAENVKLVDVVIEVIDARIPVASRNPILNEIIGDRPRIVVLNKADLADSDANKKWVQKLKSNNQTAIIADSNKGKGVNDVVEVALSLMKDKIEKQSAKGRTGISIKAMIVGIPNVGKSTFINKIAGKQTAEVSNKPGVTRKNQWVRLNDKIQLLDTPGVLWPKFDNAITARHLAYIGTIKDEILEVEELALSLLEELVLKYKKNVYERYKIDENFTYEMTVKLMEEIGRKRGCLVRGGEVDYTKVANIILDDFRTGKIGLITLE
jgi:ribosome biogenesis GTPase A